MDDIKCQSLETYANSGKIKIIHAQKNISVARLQNMLSRENLPLLEDNFIMVGDKLDLGSAESDKKNAEAAPALTPEPEPTAATTPAKIEDQAKSYAIDFASKSPEPQVPPVQVPVVQ